MFLRLKLKNVCDCPDSVLFFVIFLIIISFWLINDKYFFEISDINI